MNIRAVYRMSEIISQLFSQKNRLHDIIDGLGYLLSLSCVILDKLQRKQYFSFVEKKQHGISSRMRIHHEKKSIKKPYRVASHHL